MKNIVAFFVITLLVGPGAHAEISFPFIIQGYSSLGMSVYGEADFNLDGYRDIATTNLTTGTFIFSGKDFSKLDSIVGPLMTADNNGLTSTDADQDGYPDLVIAARDSISRFVRVYSIRKKITLYDQRIQIMTISINNIEDLDGDTVDDILVGGISGTLVLSGKSGSIIHDLGFPCNLGVILAVDDLNGDGKQDFAVSSHWADIDGSDWRGNIFLVSGSSGLLIRKIEGDGRAFGFTLAVCPDLDGDGIKDILVARPSTDTAHIYSSLSGIKITEVRKPFGRDGTFGCFTKNLGDVNGDNVSDFIIGDYFDGSVEGSPWTGAAFIYSGASLELLYSYYGVDFSYFGFSAAPLGDLDGDDKQEIAIGAPGESKVYIFSTYLPGDANQDGRITLADVVTQIRFVFHNGPRPLPMSVADGDCDGTISLSDIICTLNYLFGKGTQDCCIK